MSYVIGDISKGIYLLWLLAVSICFLEKDLVAAKEDQSREGIKGKWGYVAVDSSVSCKQQNCMVWNPRISSAALNPVALPVVHSFYSRYGLPI